MMSNSLRKTIKEFKVSSVLNNDRKLFGKKFLFDGNEETCWNSDKGVPQWIEISFPTVKEIQQLSVQFQGGFASKSCILECIDDSVDGVNDTDSNDSKKFEFFPKDSNESQDFVIESLLSSKKFKLTFTSSYDFYGRIIIYNLDIFGN